MCLISRMRAGPGLSPFSRSAPRHWPRWFALCKPVVSQFIEVLRCTSAEDSPVMKYASGFAIYETRLAMTSGSATGIFIRSEFTIPEAFAVSASTDNDNGEQLYAIAQGQH